MPENIFVDGMGWRMPHEKAPEFIRGNISVDVDKFIDFAQKHKNEKGYINIDLKKSKAGKYYLSLNTYERKSTEKEDLEYDRKCDAEPCEGETISAKQVPF